MVLKQCEALFILFRTTGILIWCLISRGTGTKEIFIWLFFSFTRFCFKIIQKVYFASKFQMKGNLEQLFSSTISHKTPPALSFDDKVDQNYFKWMFCLLKTFFETKNFQQKLFECVCVCLLVCMALDQKSTKKSNSFSDNYKRI